MPERRPHHFGYVQVDHPLDLKPDLNCYHAVSVFLKASKGGDHGCRNGGPMTSRRRFLERVAPGRRGSTCRRCSTHMFKRLEDLLARSGPPPDPGSRVARRRVAATAAHTLGVARRPRRQGPLRSGLDIFRADDRRRPGPHSRPEREGLAGPSFICAGTRPDPRLRGCKLRHDHLAAFGVMFLR